MPEFLRNFQLDRNSFVIGFILGILFWVFIGVIRPMLRRAWNSIVISIDQSRSIASRGVDVHLSNDILQRLQRLHIASALFSLDEIRVEPRILIPPPGHTPGEVATIQDITDLTVPFTPGATDFAGIYRAPSLTLAEMLSSGANLVLVGRAGSGKSFALADLACQISRKDPTVGDLGNLVPIYLHANDINPVLQEDRSPFTELLEAFSEHTSSRTSRRLPGFLENAFYIGRVLLLLDGMDELPPEKFDSYVDFLRELLSRFPTIHVVATASTAYYGELSIIGFAPVSIAAWDGIQRSNFIHQWSKLWTRYIDSNVWAGKNSADDPSSLDEEPTVDPLFVEGMLLNNQGTYTPLEFTTLVWAAFAGDMLGNNPAEGLEAYVRRMVGEIPDGREAIEQLAAVFLTRQTSSLSRKEVGGRDDDLDQDDSIELHPEEILGNQEESGSHVSVRRALSRLTDTGLLIPWKNNVISFQHSAFLAYLAGMGLAKGGSVVATMSDLRWETNLMTIAYLARVVDVSQIAQNVLQTSQDPLQLELFFLSDGLRNVPKGQTWRNSALRHLAQIVQSTSSPIVLRSRAAIALTTSGEPDVARLFRPLLSGDDYITRQLAALASGYIRDVEAVGILTERLYDTSPSVQRAACLALVNIGSEESLEQVAGALLHGDDDLRRAAAEAFSNHPEEGYPLLKDGAGLDDLLVRRATVFGLLRVHEPWANEILGQMQLEDEQWVVRAAATQAIEELENPATSAPVPKGALHDLPWLIEFASEKGMGVTTGKPAQDMLKLALKEGTTEQKIAALARISEALDNESLDLAYHLFRSEDLDIQQAAYLALWDLSRSGFELPSP